MTGWEPRQEARIDEVLRQDHLRRTMISSADRPAAALTRASFRSGAMKGALIFFGIAYDTTASVRREERDQWAWRVEYVGAGCVIAIKDGFEPNDITLI
jgi:hypothetical protein